MPSGNQGLGKDQQKAAPVATDAKPRTAKADFDDLIVICAKCAKRQGMAKHAFGRSLERAFKRETGGRRLRVVETSCLGPCPKRLIAAATADSLHRHGVVLLDPTLSSATTVRSLYRQAETDAVETEAAPSEGASS